MQTPQITFRGMPHSPAMDAKILELARKLEHLNPRITSCHVVVDETDRHKSKGNNFEVHVVLHVPGRGEIAATRSANEDAYLAIGDAFDAVHRQLEKEQEIARGDVKHHTDGRDNDAQP